MSGFNRASLRSNFGVGECQEAPTQIWEKREGEERGHMAKHDNHINSTWLWFMDGFGTL